MDLIKIIDDVFTELFTDENGKSLPYTISINNRKILQGIIESVGLQDKFEQIVVAIDKFDKIGVDKVIDELEKIGIDDETDLTKISWSKGRYDVAELTNLYTLNDQRVIRIIQSLNEIITDISQMRALAFCVSKAHANYMAKKFTLSNIPCGVLTSDNSKDRDIQQQLSLIHI